MNTKTIHIADRFQFDMDLDPDFPADRWILQALEHRTCYEPEVAHVLLRTLRPGDNAFDVGANVGFFTLMMSRLVGEEGTVTAYEPGSNNLPKLRANLGLNRMDNVKIVEHPVADSVKDVPFFLSLDDSGGNALWHPGAWPDNVKSRNATHLESGAVVRSTTLGHDAAQKPRLIKLDIEGGEVAALRGAEKLVTWKTRTPFIVAEINPFALEQMGQTVESFRALMDDYGYDLFFIYPDGSLPKLVPASTKLLVPHIMNVLFSTTEAVAEAWPEASQ